MHSVSKTHLEAMRWLMVVGSAFVLAYTAYKQTALLVLPVAFALYLIPTVNALARRFNNRAFAVAAILLLTVGGILASIVFVGAPLSIKLVDVFQRLPANVQAYLPEVQRLLDELKTQINEYHIFEKDLDVALGSLVDIFSKTFTEGGNAIPHLLGLLLAPFGSLLKFTFILVLTGFQIGYWPSTARSTRKVLDTLLPEASALICEVVGELQKTGRNVVKSYLIVVFILSPIYLVFITGMGGWFGTNFAFTPANLILISLVMGFISALPGIGAKMGVAIIIVFSLLAFPINLQGIVASGEVKTLFAVLICASLSGLAITTLESKFLTNKMMGKAVGLNSCIILTIALLGVLVGHFTGALWIIFLLMPLAVATYNVYVREKHKLEQPQGENV